MYRSLFLLKMQFSNGFNSTNENITIFAKFGIALLFNSLPGRTARCAPANSVNALLVCLIDKQIFAVYIFSIRIRNKFGQICPVYVFVFHLPIRWNTPDFHISHAFIRQCSTLHNNNKIPEAAELAKIELGCHLICWSLDDCKCCWYNFESFRWNQFDTVELPWNRTENVTSHRDTLNLPVSPLVRRFPSNICHSPKSVLFRPHRQAPINRAKHSKLDQRCVWTLILFGHWMWWNFYCYLSLHSMGLLMDSGGWAVHLIRFLVHELAANRLDWK